MIDIDILIPPAISEAIDRITELENQYTIAGAEYQIADGAAKRTEVKEDMYKLYIDLSDAKCNAYDLIIQWIDPQELEDVV